MMKYLFYVLIVSFVSVSCGNETKENVKQANSKTIEADRIEIIYFYGAKRCITCQAIEANTKKLLDSLYSKEITLGKIVYKTIDLGIFSKCPFSNKICRVKLRFSLTLLCIFLSSAFLLTKMQP